MARPRSPLPGMLHATLPAGRSRRWLVLGGVVLALLLAACGDDAAESGEDRSLAERWLRLGEDPQTSVLVYDAQPPPNMRGLLNPGADADAPEEDLLAFRVHPEGDLLGSYVMRRAEGAHVIWLFYDVPEPEGEVESVVVNQLDESPWQVTGMQANADLGVVRFQSTRGAEIEGSAFIQPNIETDAYSLTVERDGEETALEFPRGSYVPVLEASVSDGLEVLRVDPGSARLAGLEAGDIIVAVGETSVSTRRELSTALGDLARGGAGSTAITYVILVESSQAPDDEIYVVPPSRTLPDRFPAGEVWADLTVLDYTWVAQPEGRVYQAGMVTRASTTDTASGVRDALEADGWEVVEDRPDGFATILEFIHEGDGYAGSVSIDLFPPDENYTLVLVEMIQASGS